MRVLHVVRQFAPSIGGLEDIVLNLVRTQRQQHGIDARVLTLDTVFADPTVRLPRHDNVAGIPVTRIPWRGSTRYPIAPGVLWHLRDVNLVHVHAIDFFVDILALTRFIHRRPLIVLTHGGIFHTPNQARLKRLWFNVVTRLSLQGCAAVVASSANDAAMFAGLRPPRLVTIENGVDVAKLRSAGSAPLNRHRILSIGRLAPHKRIATLFALLAALRRQGPDWTLVVAGAEAGDTVASLQDAAEHAGVGSAVRFVVGAPDARLAAEAASATWFACASAYEGFGVAAVEAVAAGLIPILSRIPPFERLAASLPGSILFDPDDPADAAARIIALDRSGPPTRAALAAAADRHDWSHVTGKYVALYIDVLAEAPASTSLGPDRA